MRLPPKLPFDDRINHNASNNYFNQHLIKSFLGRIGSDLHSMMDTMTLEEICTQMQIARGRKEYFNPINAGLLLFTNAPQKYFPYTGSEAVEYLDDMGCEVAGPINSRLEDALVFIKKSAIKEELIKIPDQARALGFFNYPCGAVGEALANALYNKSYEGRNPIAGNIRPGTIEILSVPCHVPSIEGGLNASRHY